MTMDGMLLTGDVEGDKLDAYVSAAIDMMAQSMADMQQQAA